MDYEVGYGKPPRHSRFKKGESSLDRASAASAPHLPATDHPTTTAPMADPEISRFPRTERPSMPGSKTTPGLAGACNDAPASVAFRGVNNVGTRVYTLSRLNGWPIRSPTDASQSSSRRTAHGSGATWVATPSSQWTLTTYSLPVSRRTHSRYRPPDRSAAHGDLCHEAPALPVTRPSRSSATRSIDNSLGGSFLHR